MLNNLEVRKAILDNICTPAGFTSEASRALLSCLGEFYGAGNSSRSSLFAPK
jgi:hypothetical protein